MQHLSKKPRLGGRYAAKNSTNNAIRHFSKESPNLKEITIHGWKSGYLEELKHRAKQNKDLRVVRLPQGNIGRPLLLRETLDVQFLAYLGVLRDFGGIINTSIAITADSGIVQKRDKSLLAENTLHLQTLGSIFTPSPNNYEGESIG